MKYLRYADDTDGWARVITLTREEAIDIQKSYARTFEGAIYKTDEHALQEFIVFNDAYWVEEEDL